jgi:hypothetical protein
MPLIIESGITFGGGISIEPEGPFNGSANFVRASNQYLTATITANGTSVATYEWWFYLNTVGIQQGLVNTRTGSTTTNGLITWISSGNQLQTTSTSGTTASWGVSVQANTWYHAAIVRNSLSWRGYLNGSATFTNLTSTTTSTAFYLGYYNTTNPYTLNGYISNFRYVRGVQVYTGNFTVPTAPLTATQSAGTNISAISAGQTQLLLNTLTGAGFLTDTSGQGVSVTNNNGVTSNRLSPFE